jgi:hypothetical protein
MTFTFYYHDLGEYSVGAEAREGVLEVHAYANWLIARVEVKASVEVVGVGTYETPFSIKVQEGTYTLNATYHDQKASKEAKVEAGKTTLVEFEFKAPVTHLVLLSVGLLAVGAVAVSLAKPREGRGK